MKESYQKIYGLKNPIQQYAWGSYTGFSEYLGLGQSPDKPSAELWMGAHPQAPSLLLGSSGKWIGLDEFIGADPAKALGPDVARAFGGLPFLFKALSASMPLSIQVHPTKARAEAGFAREESAQIPRNAPERNYRDPNHKPELAVALSPFTAICGFRKPDEIEELLGPKLCFALGFKASGWPASALNLVREALSKRDREKHSLETTIRERVAELKESGDRLKLRAASTVSTLYEYYPHDAGALSPLFLRIFDLEPGQGLFIPPGVMHAYLGGTILEIMATSDNVLRGGLTQKHIDLRELLACLLPEAEPIFLAPKTIESPADAATSKTLGADFFRNADETSWAAPAREFRLTKVASREGEALPLAQRGPELVLCAGGRVELTPNRAPKAASRGGAEPAPDGAIELFSGMSAFIPADCGGYSARGGATLYRAADNLFPEERR